MRCEYGSHVDVGEARGLEQAREQSRLAQAEQRARLDGRAG
jgi:hypothetical protein